MGNGAYGQRHASRLHCGPAAEIDCPVCAGDLRVLHRSLSADLFFPAAFEIWMGRRLIETHGLLTNARYIAARTERDYRCCARALARFAPFGKFPLGQITPDLVMEYQEARALNEPHAGKPQWTRPAGANRIRKEVGLLIRVLRDARLWGQDEEEAFLRLRPVESDVVRALTAEEQHRLLHVAASRMQFRLIYQYTIVALQTTASTNELRALRLGDVSLLDRIIQIPRAGAKNKHRMRAIPILTEDCMWALEGLMARARELGSELPSHYLFPLRVNPGRSVDGAAASDRYDPTRPMSDSGLKKQWDAVRKAALLPALRIYDLRHTGITRMAEAGVPLPVAMTFAGHMTQRMQQRYTAISMAAQRGWGANVWGDGARPGAVGNEVKAAWPPRKPILAECGTNVPKETTFPQKSA